jgi:hypothetical protein
MSPPVFTDRLGLTSLCRAWNRWPGPPSETLDDLFYSIIGFNLSDPGDAQTADRSVGELKPFVIHR